jgi:queuine tRNA-ribosyltransferase
VTRACSFSVESTSGRARAARLALPRGEVKTPAFMPVATQATVKALAPDEVELTGARLVIMNTYHLWLRPGPEVIAAHGGLHEFSRWPHAIATDSGGYQAFSLAERVRFSEQGFEFASHLDGKRLLLSPEESMRVQGLLGSDIAMQLDVCPPGDAPPERLREAVACTTRWAERCLQAKSAGQALFGIVQGGTDVELRLAHAEALAALPLDGLALGGFSVGESREAMHTTLGAVASHLDRARPRYLMGVGTPSDLLLAIGAGVDLFDCVLPTRNARNGQVFTCAGRLSIKQARFKEDREPLEPGCACPTCSVGYSRAYLRHLFLADEILAHRLLTLHNLCHYGSLIAGARAAIVRGDYDDWAAARLLALGPLEDGGA